MNTITEFKLKCVIVKNVLASDDRVERVVDTVNNIRVKRFIIIKVIIRLECTSDRVRRVK